MIAYFIRWIKPLKIQLIIILRVKKKLKLLNHNITGKKVLKGKPLRHWTFMGFFISGILLMTSWLGIKILLISKHYFPFNFTEYFLFAGFIFFWVGMKTVVSYIKIFEEGVKVRGNGMFNYIRTRFIPFSQIREFHLEGKRHPHLILQLEREKVVVPTILVKNYKDVVIELSTRIERKR